jgi:DNA-binding transcriptional regulator YdaS (Cro superfamily)
MDHPGHGLLKLWRESFSPTTSQAAAAKRLGVSQSLIAEWEKGPRRPGLETAVMMESETGGAVPIEAWGYERSLVKSMARLVDRRRAAGDALERPSLPDAAA